jgi:outer membrane protein TolC
MTRRSNLLKMHRALIAALLLFAQAVPLRAQSDASMRMFESFVTDSVLNYNEFLRFVEAYHPLAQIADLEVDVARMQMRMARGAFDPLFFGNYRTKEFKNSVYYESLQAGVELPTWFGISLHAGYEDNGGQFLNPEWTAPSAGLLHAGLTAQLGSGLLMDPRRAAYRIGQIAQQQGMVSRTLIRNALYLDATSVYFTWCLTNQNLDVAREAVNLATVRYEAVRESYFQGDVPAIDTVEAYTQVLNRLILLREAEARWVRAVNMVSAFLWDDEGRQFDIPAAIRPERMQVRYTPEFLLPLLITPDHPELEKFRLKGLELDVERRLAQEYLRPKIELKYNALAENVLPTPVDDIFTESRFFQNNYNFGAKVAIPLPLREARGKLGMIQFKMQGVNLEQENKRAKLTADLNAALVRLANLKEQVQYSDQNVTLLSRVLDGERELFDLGESSLFLINARETSLIQAQSTLFDLEARERILTAEIMVIGGLGFP